MSNTLPIHFAPLQGYTEVIYRNAHAAFFGGIDTYYTPFVRIEKDSFKRRDLRGIEPQNNKVDHLIPQLIAPTALIAEDILALFVEKGYNEVDINMGCPYPILVKRHNGSGILPYPDEVKSLLHVIKQHPDIHFSVKMRLGWEDPEECLRLAPILNDLPLRQITMHARLGNQQYKGEVDLKGFAAFQEVCKHPLIYNGDINTLDDIKRIETEFPALAGIMIGRGLLANPALAIEYKEDRTLTSEEMKKKLRGMHSTVYEQYEAQIEGGEGQLLNKMQTYWEYQKSEENRKFLKAIHKSTNLNKYNAAVNAYFNQL